MESKHWTLTKDDLPDPGVKVLTDGPEYGPMVASLVRGISVKKREAMEAGLIDDPIVKFYGGDESKRSRVYQRGDEHGNNQRDYAWNGPGPFSIFGQGVTRWMTIPE